MLVTCDACGGSGSRLVRTSDGLIPGKVCDKCNGRGRVDLDGHPDTRTRQRNGAPLVYFQDTPSNKKPRPLMFQFDDDGVVAERFRR